MPLEETSSFKGITKNALTKSMNAYPKVSRPNIAIMLSQLATYP
jgi:hypothetical protein